MNDLSLKESLMKQFNLDDMRKFNSSDFVNLMTMYKKLDPEVAKTLIAQIPQYMKSVTESVTTVKEIAVETVKINSENINRAIDIYESRINCLNQRYNDDNITEDERDKIALEISEHLENINHLIDKESERNHDTLLKISGMIMTGIMLVGSIFGLKNLPNSKPPKHNDNHS